MGKLCRLRRELNAARAAFADNDYITWLETEIAYRLALQGRLT